MQIKKWHETPFGEENENIIIESYKRLGSINAVYRETGLNQKRIKQFLSKRGIVYKTILYKNYRSSLFDSIESHEMAYFMGFLVSDGCFFVRKDKYKSHIVKLVLKADDFEVLNQIGSLIVDGDGPYITFSKNQGRSYAVLGIQDSFASKKIFDLGFHPNKTWTIKVDPRMHGNGRFINSFVLGLFDGDGCFFRGHRKKISKKRGVRFIRRYGVTYTGNEYITQFLYDFLIKNGIESTRSVDPRYLEKENKIYNVRFSKEALVKKFGEIIYGDSKIFLKRKRNRYEEFLRYINRDIYSENIREKKTSFKDEY